MYTTIDSFKTTTATIICTGSATTTTTNPTTKKIREGEKITCNNDKVYF